MAVGKPFYCEGCGKKISYDEHASYSGKCQDCKVLEVLLKQAEANTNEKKDK